MLESKAGVHADMGCTPSTPVDDGDIVENVKPSSPHEGAFDISRCSCDLLDMLAVLRLGRRRSLRGIRSVSSAATDDDGSMTPNARRLASGDPLANAVDVRAEAAVSLQAEVPDGMLAAQAVIDALPVEALEPATGRPGKLQLAVFGRGKEHLAVTAALFGTVGEGLQYERLCAVLRGLAATMAWCEEHSTREAASAGYKMSSSSTAAITDAAKFRSYTKSLVAKCAPGLKSRGRSGSTTKPAESDAGGGGDAIADGCEIGSDAAWLPVFVVAASLDLAMLAMLAQMDPAIPSNSPVLADAPDDDDEDDNPRERGEHDSPTHPASPNSVADSGSIGISGSARVAAERARTSGWRAELVASAQRYAHHTRQAAANVRMAFEGRSVGAIRRRAAARQEARKIAAQLKAESRTLEESKADSARRSVELESASEPMDDEDTGRVAAATKKAPTPRGWDGVVLVDIRATDLFLQTCKRAAQAFSRIREQFDEGRVAVAHPDLALFSEVKQFTTIMRNLTDSTSELTNHPALSSAFSMTNNTLATVTIEPYIQAWTNPQIVATQTRGGTPSGLRKLGKDLKQSGERLKATLSANQEAALARGKPAVGRSARRHDYAAAARLAASSLKASKRALQLAAKASERKRLAYSTDELLTEAAMEASRASGEKSTRSAGIVTVRVPAIKRKKMDHIQLYSAVLDNVSDAKRSRDVSQTVTLVMRRVHETTGAPLVARVRSDSAHEAEETKAGVTTPASEPRPSSPLVDKRQVGSSSSRISYTLLPGESVVGLVEVTYPSRHVMNGKVMGAVSEFIHPGDTVGGNVVFVKRGLDAGAVGGAPVARTLQAGGADVAAQVRFHGVYGKEDTLVVQSARAPVTAATASGRSMWKTKEKTLRSVALMSGAAAAFRTLSATPPTRATVSSASKPASRATSSPSGVLGAVAPNPAREVAADGSELPAPPAQVPVFKSGSKFEKNPDLARRLFLF